MPKSGKTGYKSLINSRIFEFKLSRCDLIVQTDAVPDVQIRIKLSTGGFHPDTNIGKLDKLLSELLPLEGIFGFD